MKETRFAVVVLALGSVATAPLACSSAEPSGSHVGELSSALAAGSPIVSAIGGKCLDDSGDQTANGNKIQLWSCNATGAQDWSYRGGTLVGPGGKCLDVKYDEQQDGTVVWLYACNGTAAQQWTIDGAQIKTSAGLCLDARGGVNADGTQVQIWACDPTNPNQHWTSASTITPADAGTPPPPPPPSAGLPYVFSSVFSQAQDGTSPLMTPVSTLATLGLTTQLGSSFVANFWNEGIATGDSPLTANGPVYVVSSTINADAPELTFEANLYGANKYNGTRVHVPRFALNQCGSLSASSSGADCHLVVIDQLNGIEIDGWQCANGGGGGTYDGEAQPGKMTCSWGGVFPLGGNGLRSDGYGGNHGGFALGMIDLTPQEILDAEKGTPIKHALVLGTYCLNNPTVYPADTTSGSDKTCNGGAPGSYPQYGDMVRLVPSYDVAASSYSAPCKAVLSALQTYGAYFGDTGWYTQAFSLSDYVYSSDPSKPSDAWTTVLGQMVAGGDASGSGDRSAWSSCLNRLSAADFEMFQIAPKK